MVTKRSQRLISCMLAGLILLTLFSGSSSGLIGKLVTVLNYPGTKVQITNTHQITGGVNPVPSNDSKSVALAGQLRAKPIQAVVVKRVINPYQRQVLINAGTRDGVSTGQLVISSGYLAGRVAKVSAQEAWLQLVSDPDFRIGLQIESTSAEAILKGSGTAIFVDRVPAAGVVAGKSVSTYGNGNDDLAGIPVGQIGSEVNQPGLTGLKKYLLDRSVREEFVNQVIVLRPEAESSP